MTKRKKTIAEQILEQRKISGLTQRQICYDLGLDESAVSRWERGLNSPSVNDLNKMCDLYGWEFYHIPTIEGKIINTNK